MRVAVTSRRLDGLILGIGLAVLVGAVPVAFSLPSFSRTSGLSCDGCHRDGPQLNERGLSFLASGYRMASAHGSEPPRFPGLSVEAGVGLGVSADEWPTRRFASRVMVE